MDLPSEKHARVCLACKGKNGHSNIVFEELTISDSYKTWQRRVQSPKPTKRVWVTETSSVFVVNSRVVVGEILYIKVIGRDISGGHFSKLETFVVRPLMIIEDWNCARRWYTKSVPWKRKSWIKLSDCEATPNYYRYKHRNIKIITFK